MTRRYSRNLSHTRTIFLQGIETADADGCSSECERNAKCSHWTFVGKWKVNCYLKNKLGHDAPAREGAAAFYLMLDLITLFDLCHASRNMASSTLIFSTVAEVERADNDSLRKMRARCVRHFWIHHVPRVPELKRVKARHPNLARR